MALSSDSLFFLHKEKTDILKKKKYAKRQNDILNELMIQVIKISVL